MAEQAFEIGTVVGETEACFVHPCTLSDGGVGLLKLAKTPADNSAVEHEAFVLDTLRNEAVLLEAEYVKVRKDPSAVLNYHFCFPNLLENFIAEEKEGRRVLIENFVAAPDDVSKLIPLIQLIEKAKVRVDQKSSVWIMGKILKLLTFAHSRGISVGSLTTENILIEPDKHYIVVFDWSKADVGYTSGVPADVCREEISQAAQSVTLALGGNLTTGEIPDGDEPTNIKYEKFLRALATGSESNPQKAHEKFYALVESLWPRKYHPFTTHKLEE